MVQLRSDGVVRCCERIPLSLTIQEETHGRIAQFHANGNPLAFTTADTSFHLIPNQTITDMGNVELLEHLKEG